MADARSFDAHIQGDSQSAGGDAGCPTLSILICSLNRRHDYLARVRDVLDPQCEGKSVEVLVETDDGEQPTGRKRNSLLRRATGRYVAFVDDDDLVSDRYVDSILSAILHSEPDCCSLTGILLMDGVQSGIFEHSLAFDRWFEPAPGRYNRCPNHLNPVKRELALQAGFPDDLYFAEDRAYSERLRPLLKTQETIPNPIYLYDCRTVKA